MSKKRPRLYFCLFILLIYHLLICFLKEFNIFLTVGFKDVNGDVALFLLRGIVVGVCSVVEIYTVNLKQFSFLEKLI